MPNLAQIKLPSPIRLAISSTFAKSALMVLSILILAPLTAHAQGSPFDTGFNAIQSLFTGTIAKVASLVAIVIGHGEVKLLAQSRPLRFDRFDEVPLGGQNAADNQRPPSDRDGTVERTARQTDAQKAITISPALVEFVEIEIFSPF